MAKMSVALWYSPAAPAVPESNVPLYPVFVLNPVVVALYPFLFTVSIHVIRRVPPPKYPCTTRATSFRNRLKFASVNSCSDMY